MKNATYYKSPNFVYDVTFSLIMAVDNRGAIGFNNDLPWKGFVNNKTDMEWFKEKTKGKIVVMGYNTWVSIGSKPLPARVNIVVTGKHGNEVRANVESYLKGLIGSDKKPATVLIAPSPALAKSAIKTGHNNFHNGGEVMVIGGAKIYEAFMPDTSRIYLTTFDGEFEADTFVHLDLTDFDLVYRDKTKHMEPKFEIWNVTEAAAKRADSDIMQIEYIYKPAEGIAAEIMKERAEKKDV